MNHIDTRRPGKANDRNSSPLFILVAMVTAVAAFYVAKAIVLPIALAILLSFLLTPLVDRLERWRIPRIPAVLSVVLFAFAILGGVGWIVTNQLIDLSLQLPQHESRLIKKIESIRPDSPTLTMVTKTLTDLRNVLTNGKPTNAPNYQSASPAPPSENGAQSQADAANSKEARAERLAAEETLESLADSGQMPEKKPDHSAVAVKVVELPPSPLTQIQTWLGPLVAPLTTAGMVVVLVLFMLIDRENQRSRIVQLFGRSHMHATTEAIHDVARRVGRYVRMLFLVNASYGLAVAVGLWFIGVPGAIMWGVLGFSLRFLPYLGPWIAATLPILVAVATSNGWTQPLLVLGWYIVVELVSNNVIEPLVYGNTIGISTVGVIIAAIFWTWLWGPIGLILAMPMTVCLVVTARYVPQLRFITILLADRPPLSQAERVYQRLLAFDYQEPLKIARKHLKDATLVSYYDEVLVPALTMAEQDRHADLLNDEQAAFVLEAAEDLVAELGDAAVPARLADIHEDINQPAPGETVDDNAVFSARILCVPLRDDADETTSRMLAQLLIAEGFPVLTAGAESLTAEVVDRVAATDADIVVISILPPILPRDSRLLWKRLRSHYPNLPIIVGFWSGTNQVDDLPVSGQDDHASRIATTLAEAVSQVRAIAAQRQLIAKTG